MLLCCIVMLRKVRLVMVFCGFCWSRCFVLKVECYIESVWLLLMWIIWLVMNGVLCSSYSMVLVMFFGVLVCLSGVCLSIVCLLL